MPYNNLADLQTLTLGSGVECDNACCILTLDCTVQLMGNMAVTGYASGSTLFTLPETMAPVYDVAVPVMVIDGENPGALAMLVIQSDGNAHLVGDIEDGMVYTNGLNVNVCDRYYNSEIGNNFSQGTSPLRYDGDAE